MPRKLKPDDPAESKRFIDMAREIGADESEKGQKAFERAFEKVIRSKTPTKPKEMPAPKGRAHKGKPRS
jgi:hypothetical protein